jgi:undecaprenyl diphosphate synthase
MSADQADRSDIQWPAVLPKHVAIVMDGNGRWARARSLPRQAGHKAGATAVRRVTEACARLGIGALTLFAFSSENWQRPKTEVSVLMELFLRTLERQVGRLEENNVRLRLIGDRLQFSSRLQEQIQLAEERTEKNTGLQLVIAASYGGRWDIATAARRLASQVQSGRMAPEDITPASFERHISTADLPEPDLFIRTGGEKRISNFLLWQLAYTELYFTDVLWPDFDEAQFAVACSDFARRQRRFGRTPEQLEQPSRA